jgi:quinol monooxygenase YgiN
MTTSDTSCTIAPYFKMKSGQADACKKLCERFVERSRTEPGCLYYGFAFLDDVAFCREGYVNAEAALAHLDNVSDLLAEGQKIMDLERLEIHGPAAELAKLRGPLAAINPQFFTLEVGFRK